MTHKLASWIDPFGTSGCVGCGRSGTCASAPARSSSPRARPPEVISAFLNGRRPNIASHSVCIQCKRSGAVCVMVARGVPCLGPVTHAGCGALCPRHARGCYGCFGPMESPNTASLSRWWRRELEVSEDM